MLDERHDDAMHSGSHEKFPHARWVQLSAALFAVVAAIGSLLANRSATEALQLKNEAIFVRTQASDSYNFYESKSIKQHLYEAATISNTNLTTSASAKLSAIARRENTEKAPILARAKREEERATTLSGASERAAHAHEIMEGGVTLFEVAIAIVSISALTESTFLIGFGVLAATGGLAILLYGLSQR